MEKEKLQEIVDKLIVNAAEISKNAVIAAEHVDAAAVQDAAVAVEVVVATITKLMNFNEEIQTWD